MDVLSHNRLATASSPYLRMHAGNPVHWQPWDEATLAAARECDLPILLSIGYSACHWCHVMARESFEDAAIAAAMNAAFVNIKLDREERPDIDHVYQLAHQAMSGRGGGWPLTAFLDPTDLAPFYIGTYFPPTARRGLPGFPEVLSRVRAYFDSHRDDLRGQSQALRHWLEQLQAAEPAAVDPQAAETAAMQRLSARFDPRWGGNRGAPKFPRAAELEWLLDRDDDEAREMACLTLRQMAMRGLQDHLGGGFFRYCVDEAWSIPHFEKMLYDNAQLLPVYARIAATDGAPADLRALADAAAGGIVDWLEREMTAPDGTLYSALGADSEGQEGHFYLWSPHEVRDVLPPGPADAAIAAYGLDGPPNFEHRAWHLLRTGDTGSQPGDAERAALLAARNERVRPERDDKRLTAWNALAAAGLARAARASGDHCQAGAAARIAAALHAAAWVDGELYANLAPPDARIPGFLDDYALLLDALLELLQLDFTADRLAWAIALAERLPERFGAPDGGFWLAAAGHATPLTRGRDWTDGNLPNGSAVAIRSLLRLGHLVGDEHHTAVAERALRAAGGALGQFPDACPTLLRALHESAHPRRQVVVRCPPADAAGWRQALDQGLRGAGTVPGGDPVDAFVIPATLEGLPGLLAERPAGTGHGLAYLCEGFTCLAPVTSPAALADALRDRDTGGA